MTDTRGSTPPAEPGDRTCDGVRDVAASFVLDALPAAEADAVRAHLAACAEPHPELLELAAALPALLESVPLVEPPPSLKARIMAAAAADLEARGGSVAGPAEASTSAKEARGGPVGGPAETSAAQPATPAEQSATAAEPPVAFPTATEREARRETRRLGAGPSRGAWAWRLAAVLAIVGLAGWNVLLQGQLAAARSYEQQVAAVLDVAGHEGALAAVLTPAEGSTASGLAAVDANGQVRLAMRALPATHGEQVYETWVIGADEVPVAVGGFRVGADGIGYFEGNGIPVQPGNVLALTLEPGPDATVPTTPPVSLGIVGAAAG